MKTIEEKAKRYDEAIEMAKEFKEHLLEINDKCYADEMDYIFPELKESEDERISREITEFLVDFNNGEYERPNENTIDSWLSWLEKQGEQKPTEDVDLPEFESHLCLMFQKFRTKGICTNGEIIDYVKEHSQKLKDILVKPAWSEEDEKIYQSIMDDTVQENQLNDKQTNWLRDIKYRYFPQPKQEWSEDTQQWIDAIIFDYESWYDADKDHRTTIQAKINILKSLKDRYTWKPSDEQIEILDMVLTNASMDDNIARILRELREQLKKLKG